MFKDAFIHFNVETRIRNISQALHDGRPRAGPTPRPRPRGAKKGRPAGVHWLPDGVGTNDFFTKVSQIPHVLQYVV